MSRRAPLACLSVQSRARWLAEMYGPETRARMLLQCGRLCEWSAWIGRHREAVAWEHIHDALYVSLFGLAAWRETTAG